MRQGIKIGTMVLAAAWLLGAAPVQAYEAGDWLLRVGVGSVDPKSNNGDLAEVDSGATLVFNGTYMMTPNWGVEVLASLPFSHDINLKDDGSKVAETKHLPPTVSAQYHFLPDGTFRPYVGLGLNYTLFFDQSTTGALAGTDLDLDNSFGLAAQIGADFDIGQSFFLNAELRWIDIDTDATVDGTDVGGVEIDPLVYAINLGFRF